MAGFAFDDRLTAVFLSLVRSGLWERPLSGEELFRVQALQEGEWERIWKMAVRQTVTGLLAAALEHLPDTVDLPRNVEYAAFASMDRLAAGYRHQLQAVEELSAFFRGQGLEPLYMKGLEAARLYPRPRLRELGDIDIFFPENAFEKALEAVRGHLADTLTLAPDGSMHFRFRGLDVDLHRSYFDLPLRAPLPDTSSPEAQLLMLNMHILKHACAAGVGLRQLCDMARAYAALPYSEPLYLDLCKKAGILRWTHLLSSFLKKNLGASNLPISDAQVPDPAPLERIVRRGGNFGHHSHSRQTALSMRPFFRKADTFFRMLSSIPFSLRYAPRTTFHWLSSLLPGQFSGKKA